MHFLDSYFNPYNGYTSLNGKPVSRQRIYKTVWQHFMTGLRTWLFEGEYNG